MYETGEVTRINRVVANTSERGYRTLTTTFVPKARDHVGPYLAIGQSVTNQTELSETIPDSTLKKVDRTIVIGDGPIL